MNLNIPKKSLCLKKFRLISSNLGEKDYKLRIKVGVNMDTVYASTKADLLQICTNPTLEFIMQKTVSSSGDLLIEFGEGMVKL